MFKHLITVITAILVLSGCAHHEFNQNSIEKLLSDGVPNYLKESKVTKVQYQYIEREPDFDRTADLEWLRAIRVSIGEPSRPINLKELARMFTAQGVPITYSLPLDGYTYSGFGVPRTDAYSALKLILSSMNLDFEVNDKARTVEIIPMTSMRWTLNATPTTSTFDISGESSGLTSSESGGKEGELTGISSNSSETSRSSVSSESDFWANLTQELNQRLTILLPTLTDSVESEPIDYQERTSFGGDNLSLNSSNIRPLSRASGSSSFSSQAQEEPFREVRVGRLSINKDTGSVVVQAPQFILNEIADYMEDLEEKLNSVVSINGLIVFVSSDDKQRQGIDLSAFATFAGEYGLQVTNNALGGLTVSGGMDEAGNISLPAVQAINGNGTNIGISSNDNMLRVFSAFLENNGEVTTLQRPNMSSSHGVPAVFSAYDTTYVNTVSEESAAGSGDGNAAVARTNTLVPFQFGTALRVLPRYSPEDDLVRAQIALTQVLEAGTQVVEQVVGGANGGIQALQTVIPLDRRIDVAGEVIIPDGSLIVFGGQRVSSINNQSSGVTGLKDTFLGSLFGNRTKERSETLYYVALQVSVHKREA